MGKVYEALTRSETEQRQAAAAAGLAREQIKEPRAAASAAAEGFDFVRYSLDTPPANQIERNRMETEAVADERAAEAQPAREVQLTMTQLDPHLVQFYESDLKAAEEYNRLAASLIAASRTRPLSRMLITSPKRGDGRTSVALNLACALARAKKRVLLVDTDLQRPSVLRLLGIGADLGISEVLDRSLPAGTATVRVLPHGFVVLPSRERIDNPAEVLGSPSFHEMLNLFEQNYDFMLFDSAPLLDSNDRSLLMSLTNAALLVIRPETTTSSELGKAITPLSQDRIFGVVLNRVA